MSLLPWSDDDLDPSQDGEIVVLDVDDETADQIFSVLSSATARTLLSTILDESGTPSELADRVDTTVQNVMYHLERLEAAGLIRVAGTQYSQKGKEMKVYAPAENPLVMFVGTDERKTGLLTILERIVGAIGVAGITSLFAHILLTGKLPFVDMLGSTGGQSSTPLVISAFIGSLLTILGVLGWRLLHNRHLRYINNSRPPTWAELDTSTIPNRAAVAAGFLFILSAGFWLLRGLEANWVGTLTFFHVLLFSTVLSGILAGGVAYYSRQMLICWLFPFAIFAGVPVYTVGAIFSGAAPLPTAVFGTMYLIAVVFGAAITGTLGYVIGRGLRLSVESLRLFSTDIS